MIQASKIIGTGLATTLLNDDFYYSLSCSNFFHEYYILDTFVYLFALPPLGGGGFPPPYPITPLFFLRKKGGGDGGGK